jgi:hypothetical protein
MQHNVSNYQYFCRRRSIAEAFTAGDMLSVTLGFGLWQGFDDAEVFEKRLLAWLRSKV